MMQWLSVFIGISGVSAIAFGAAGAHVVQDIHAAALVEKASYYQLLHTAAMLAIADRHEKNAISIYCWMLGIIFFCGSLYAKAFGIISNAPLAPAGGITLMVGWLALVFTFRRGQNK